MNGELFLILSFFNLLNVALRGIEPRSPGFHSGAFLSILPKHHLFVMNMADLFFLITEFIHQQTADEERFELSTLPLTTGRSAVELFIQSIGQ
jgi:hypothetical protein